MQGADVQEAGVSPDTSPGSGSPLAGLGRLLAEEPALSDVLGRRGAALSVAEPGLAPVLAAIAELNDRRPLLVATRTSTAAQRLASDLSALLHGSAVLFPAWETLPFERVSPGLETMGRRARTLWELGQPQRCPTVVVAPVRALLQRLLPGDGREAPLSVRVGDRVDLQEFVQQLTARGYRRDAQVEHRGMLAVRGSIIDVFGSTADWPVRIDLWGDEVERLTEFSLASQRSTRPVAEAEIFCAREVRPDAEVRAAAETLIASRPWGREQWERLADGQFFDGCGRATCASSGRSWERLADGQFFDGMESWLPWLTDREETLVDRLGPEAQVVLVDPAQLHARSSDIAAEEADLATTLAATWGAHDEAFPRLHVDLEQLLARCEVPAWSLTTVPEGPSVPTVAASSWDSPVGDPEAPSRQLARLLAEGYRVTVAADGEGSAARLADLLSQHGTRLPVVAAEDATHGAAGNCITVAPLQQGFVLPGTKLAVLAEADLVGRRRAHRRQRRRSAAGREFDDLTPGDYVVHQQHGVARYAGMCSRVFDGVARDYLQLEYRGSDRLYVPTDQIHTVRRYSGGETPKLNRMGGADWQRTKTRVRSAVSEVAQELVALYQARTTAAGRAYSPDTPWQAEMEAAFGYQLTPDQATAIADIKQDMERLTPMDRLLCGDVGFGKTEVALRAAFKAVQDGVQAAVLVPTTLLAQQHYQTFSDRLADTPVRVEVLSRFLSPKQVRGVLAGLADGTVDLVVGTHRLLSGDVVFHDLGLLVIDEEQRFGVTHKEAIKTLKTGVDVLALSATPIPRTLEMSLTGIRDLSLLHTPPADRQPILTYVGGYEERAVAEAIRRELLREGQVFFVHNRVVDIEHVAEGLRRLVPEARIAVAHGQMDEGALEQVAIDFWEQKYDVLVCTTIIESGIDMPTVNTLVVHRAEHLGLGQLHQLRGRVGRAGTRAYAYLFTPPNRALTPEAYERLKTIGESTELGSGFKIAMRDLEIRGAGNMLGTGQSGHIAAVGYDLYCQLVTEAVAELKGEPVDEPPEVSIELPVQASLPQGYMPTEELRLEAYRRVAAAIESEALDDIAVEWEDRYGPLPDEAQGLLAVARLRAACIRAGVQRVSATGVGGGFGRRTWTARLEPLKLQASHLVRLDRVCPGASYDQATGVLRLGLHSADTMLENLLAAVEELAPAEAATSEASEQVVELAAS